MQKITFTTMVLLLIVGTSLAQHTHQEKERILDLTGFQSQVDRESLHNPVETTASTKSNELCTVLFSWTGEDDYTMSATMTYDPSQAVGGVVSAQGLLPSPSDPFNNGIIDLVVSFYDQDGVLMETIVNVGDGVILYTNWLSVLFDINDAEFVGYFDVGQYNGLPVPGADNLNLYGIIGDYFYFEDETYPPFLDESDDDFVLDIDDVSCQGDPVAVPISSIAFLALILLMLGFVFFRLRFVRIYRGLQKAFISKAEIAVSGRNDVIHHE